MWSSEVLCFTDLSAHDLLIARGTVDTCPEFTKLVLNLQKNINFDFLQPFFKWKFFFLTLQDGNPSSCRLTGLTAFWDCYICLATYSSQHQPILFAYCIFRRLMAPSQQLCTDDSSCHWLAKDGLAVLQCWLYDRKWSLRWENRPAVGQAHFLTLCKLDSEPGKINFTSKDLCCFGTLVDL